MPRPQKCRRVAFMPGVTYFKPAGIPLRELEENQLTIEEAESIRLKDIENMGQEQCAENMNISRPTFQRVLASARKKIADALLNGKAIRITGGNYEAIPWHLVCSKSHEWEIQFTSPAEDMPLCPICKAPAVESSLPQCWRGSKHRCCNE